MAGLVLAGMAVVLVLPTVLRPPPDEANQSAELSPDAPPEEDPDAIIQSLRQAGSRTAGATGDVADGPSPTTTTTVIKAPARGTCYGNPPRMTDSYYSPPCRAAFTGDNEGSTYTNVTGDLVRVGYWHVFGMPAVRGPISFTPVAGEDAGYRTARVIQAYFNEKYELYGRRLQLVAMRGDPADAPAARAQAVQAMTQDRIFAGVHLDDNFCDEMARRSLVCFNGNATKQKIYEEHSPYWWSYQMNLDQVDRFAAEYTCKKLVGTNAAIAGGTLKNKARKIGVIVMSNAGNSFRTARHIADEMQAKCGFKPADTADVDGGKPESVATAVGRMSANGITTIVLEADSTTSAIAMAAADGLGYPPEWVMFNSYGLDLNDGARIFLPPTQLARVFGMSGWELPRPLAATDCYRAYKSVDPANEPDANFCQLLWISIEQIVNGIQEAGPKLTPDSFAQGLYSMPLDPARASWAIDGRFAPHDHAFVDSLVEMWWDPNAIDPDGGETGAYRFVADGRRWKEGQIDRTQRVFREGVTGYSP